MEILLFLGLVVFVVHLLSKKKPKKITIEPKISISVSTSSSSFDNPDSGALTQNGVGWLLNPKAAFHLHVDGVSSDVAVKIKEILEKNFSGGYYQSAKELTEIFAGSNARCREVDAYVATYKPTYLQQIEDLKRASPEWATASDKDKEDLLDGFKAEAISTLDVRPSADLAALFEDAPLDEKMDDALISAYGFESFNLYLRYADKLDKARQIQPDNYYRKEFERLVELGLAVRGADIEIGALLESATLKELNLLAEGVEKPFARKAKAVEYLLAQPDIKQRFGNKIGFREFFQLKPLPPKFSYIDLHTVSKGWRHLDEVVGLLARTYSASAYAIRERNTDLSDVIKGWEVLATDDSCPCCKRAAAIKYAVNRLPVFPLHVGCRCAITPTI